MQQVFHAYRESTATAMGVASRERDDDQRLRTLRQLSPERAMNRRRFASSRANGIELCICALVTVCAFALLMPAASAGPVTKRLAVSAPHSVTQTFILHLDGGPIDVTPATRVVVLNAFEISLARQLRAAHPRIELLVYKDMSSTRSYPGAVVNGIDAKLLPAGVGYEYATTTHPEWFLLDQQGNRVEWQGYPDHWQMNTSISAYQQAWTANVLTEVRENHWDGVYIDNAMTTAAGYDPGLASPALPTDAAMQAATFSMLSAVSSVMHQNGFKVYANIPDARSFRGLWQKWLRVLDGAHEEMFAKWTSRPGEGYVWDWHWTGILAQIGELQAGTSTGKLVSVETQASPDDRDAADYAMGCYLLGSGRGTSFQFGTKSVAFAASFADLGMPLRKPRQIAPMVWERAFTHGTVVVNVGSKTTSAKLGRTFVNVAGRKVTQVRLRRETAVALRAESA